MNLNPDIFADTGIYVYLLILLPLARHSQDFIDESFLCLSAFEADENKRFAGLRAETELDVVLKTLCAMTRQSCKCFPSL